MMFLLSIVPFFLFWTPVSALQVTPNSPCSQFCLDRSDPNSYETRGDEIVCDDDDFKRKAAGQKFQRCLACLQDSAFKQGDESDQDWFLCKSCQGLNCLTPSDFCAIRQYALLFRLLYLWLPKCNRHQFRPLCHV